jgi:hypothetical protein
VLPKLFLTCIMFAIKYWVDKRQFVVLGEMVKEMITADTIASIRRIWTGVGQIEYFHNVSYKRT